MEGYGHLDLDSQKIEIFCNKVASIALMNPAHSINFGVSKAVSSALKQG